MSAEFINAFQWPPQLPEIKEALNKAFDDGQWGKYDGENCRSLTTNLADLLGLEFVRLCSSGTIATEIALRSIGIKQQDHVILAGYDFPGNFRSIENIGALPVLADIKKDTWCIDLDSIKEAVTDQTRAIIVSYLHGGFADIARIREFANEKNIRVVEDICQCPGSVFSCHGTSGQNAILGSFGDVCVMSFGGSKLLSAGRGGALASAHESVFQRAKIFCDRGNNAFPLSELQAAVLIPQLARLNQFAERRKNSFQWLRERLKNESSLFSVEGSITDFFKVPFRLGPVENKQQVIDELRAKGILIDHGFRGFASRSSKRCLSPVSLRHSVEASESTLVLHHPCLLSDQFHSIIEEVIRVVLKYGT